MISSFDEKGAGPKLSTLLKIESANDTPSIHLMHGREKINRQYHYLEDFKGEGLIDAKLIMSWARF